MKVLKISMALFSSYSLVYATPYESAQNLLKSTLETLQKHQNSFLVAGFSTAVAAYLGYAIYLDGAINDTNSLWHWSMHHIHHGIIDRSSLLEHIEQRYPDLKAVHSLAAILATIFAAQREIDSCLTMRSILKNLKGLNLEWILSETIERLDKKLESLYLLKIELWQSTLEIRSNYKKMVLPY